MNGFLERHSQNAIYAALLTSVLALVGSGMSGWLTFHFASVSQDRQARIEQIAKFDAASSQLLEAAGMYLTAINSKQDLAPARLKVATVVATQILETENLRKLFDGKLSDSVSEYQSALAEFNQIANKTQSAADMRPWSESFGRVLDLKSTLSRRLAVSLGLHLKEPGA